MSEDEVEHKREVLQDLRIVDTILAKYFGPQQFIRKTLKSILKEYEV